MTSRQTSEFGYYVRGQARETTGQGPTSSGRTRAIANNLDHLSDEANQSYANVAANLSANWTQVTSVVGTYSALDSFPAIPVLPLRRESDFSSCRLAITLTAYCSVAGPDKALFLVTMKPLRPSASAYQQAPVTSVSETATQSFSGTTPTTVVLTIYCSRLTDAWLLPHISGRGSVGELASVRMYAAQVEVWATSENAAVHPVMESIGVRGWVG